MLSQIVLISIVAFFIWGAWLMWQSERNLFKSKRKRSEYYYPEKPKREEKETFELTQEVHWSTSTWIGDINRLGSDDYHINLIDEEVDLLYKNFGSGWRILLSNDGIRNFLAFHNRKQKLFHTDEDSKK